MASGLQTAEELQANLAEYKEQLQQVEELLLMDPSNEEMNEMYNSLAEAIKLTEELLAEFSQQQKDAAEAVEQQAQPQQQQPASTLLAGIAGLPAGVGAAGPGLIHPSLIMQAGATIAAQLQPAAKIVTPPELNLPSILPQSVAEHIRKAQVRAALKGDAPVAWAIGARCQALYAADGQWYNATVKAVSTAGNFVVQYEGYTEEEEVPLQSVRPPTEANEVYKGVSAPKRKRVEEDAKVDEVPKWLEIREADDEKTKARKRKLLKSYKSKIRFQQMDRAQKEKQDNWQSFLKGAKKKAPGLKGKESMFKVPDGAAGKVGVIGSGKGMTDYQRRHKHEFALDD